MNTLTIRGALAPLWLTISLLHCTHLQAATWTWDGSNSEAGNANWNNKRNWTSETVAANDGTADIVFNGVYELANNLNATWSIRSLTFASTAGNFVIGGSNTLTINADGITSNDAGTQTVNVHTALGTSQTWSSTAGNLVIGTAGANRTLTSNGHTLTLDGAGTTLINSHFSGSGGLIKNGTGTLSLSGTNTYTGTTALTVGTTVINGDHSAATGAVTVSSGATLSGAGTIGGAATISGTHAPGAAPYAAGTQTFNNGLTYAAGSIFAWDITESSTTSGYDKVAGSGSLSIDSSTIFRVVLGSGIDLDSNFWTSDRTWTDVFTGLIGGNFNNDMLQVALPSGEILVSNGAPPSLFGHGHFTVSGTSLNWSANPEPSSAVVGVLLAAGLLRRKRA